MKNKILTILILLIAGFSGYSQKKEKIKGNKEVAEIYGTLDNFNTIELNDNVKVNLTQGNKNTYQLITDQNLLNVIQFEISENILKIFTSKKIISSKKLEINLTFSALNEIILKDDTELISINKLVFNDLTFSAYNNAKYNLDLDAVTCRLNLYRGSNGKFKFKGENLKAQLNENAYLKGIVNSDILEINLKNRSDIALEGNVENLTLIAEGSTDIKAKKLRSDYVNLTASNNSDIYVHANKKLIVYAKGKSDIYVFGNPEIKIEGLNDKSKIIKK
jgi:hypothetical protein